MNPVVEIPQIGTVLPVSGDLSTLGPGMQKAIDLAFELVNEAGGVNGGGHFSPASRQWHE